MRARPPGIFNSSHQMAAVFCGFIAVILVVESRGLQVWAERLEVGPLRTVALRVTSSWRRAMQPLGLESFRETAITDLARVRWSDDAAQTAESETAEAAHPAQTPLQPVLPQPPAADLKAPLVASVPRSTRLPAINAPTPGRPRVIALTGDSMMTVGLSAVLLRETANRQDLHVVKAYRSGTGLARPEVFDWMRQYPAMLASEHPDIVIVALGANDGQGFVENGEVLAFGTDKWIEVYRRRLASFLELISAGGAQVIWIGLPPMKMENYNRRMEEINRIVYTVVNGHPKATWWNPAPYIGDEMGAFREFLTTSDGRTLRIRASDGIHISDEGASLLIPVLLHWLDQQTPSPVTPTNRAAAAVITPSALNARRGISR
ncbi:MAG TPA: DUF459 domain-containing protein [Terriglobia bacterium]|nr:DUF459 domain-containing protein [Terriglobia bacterium]